MFLYSQWTKLPLSTRVKIASDFGIAKTMPTHVFDNRILQDGYDLHTVEYVLNIDNIQKYVGSEETDMAVLWDLLVMKAEGREAELVPRVVEEEAPVVPPTVEVIVIETPVPTEVVQTPKKRGRKPKK